MAERNQKERAGRPTCDQCRSVAKGRGEVEQDGEGRGWMGTERIPTTGRMGKGATRIAKHRLCHPFAMWPSVSHLTFLGLTFLLLKCEVGRGFMTIQFSSITKVGKQ